MLALLQRVGELPISLSVGLHNRNIVTLATKMR